MTTLPKGIRKRGNSYVADITVAGQRRTASAPTLEEAIVLRAQLSGRGLHGLAMRPQAVWTIDKAIGVTQQVAWSQSPSDWERNAMRNVRAFAKFFGRNCPLDQVTTESLDQWARRLASEGKADGTINRYLMCASKLFTVAQERGGVIGRPKFPRRREAKGRIRFLSPEEEHALVGTLRVWGKDDEADLVVVLVDTGLRLSEALNLEYRDIDFKITKMIHVWDTKNGEPRSVPMTRRVAEILENRMCDIFVTPRAGEVVKPSGPFILSRFTFRATWDRARAHLGYSNDPQFVPHALRHTCASRLVQRGIGLKVVQQWLGHKSISMTMRYAHLTPNDLRNAVEVLEQG